MAHLLVELSFLKLLQVADDRKCIFYLFQELWSIQHNIYPSNSAIFVKNKDTKFTTVYPT